MSDTTARPIYSLGLRLLDAAMTKHGTEAKFYWKIGPDAQREIFLAGVYLRNMTPEEIAASHVKPALDGDMEFCNRRAFVDQSMGGRIELWIGVMVGSDTIAA